jgi:hypothetical protein
MERVSDYLSGSSGILTLTQACASTPHTSVLVADINAKNHIDRFFGGMPCRRMAQLAEMIPDVVQVHDLDSWPTPSKPGDGRRAYLETRILLGPHPSRCDGGAA